MSFGWSAATRTESHDELLTWRRGDGRIVLGPRTCAACRDFVRWACPALSPLVSVAYKPVLPCHNNALYD